MMVLQKEDTNKGTLTLDATCAPANIRYPQDISLLNEAREKLENMIYCFCKCYGLKLPRRYRKRARKRVSCICQEQKAHGKENPQRTPQTAWLREKEILAIWNSS